MSAKKRKKKKRYVLSVGYPDYNPHDRTLVMFGENRSADEKRLKVPPFTVTHGKDVKFRLFLEEL